MHEHCKFVVDGSLLNMLMLTAQDALCYTNLGLLGASPDLLESSDPAAEACLNNLCFVMRSVCCGNAFHHNMVELQPALGFRLKGFGFRV